MRTRSDKLAKRFRVCISLRQSRYRHCHHDDGLKYVTVSQRCTVFYTLYFRFDKPKRPNHLAQFLRTGFERFGFIDNFETAIRIQHHDSQHSHWGPACISSASDNLGCWHHLRHKPFGVLDDLDCAIAEQRHAIERTFAGYLDNLLWLHSFGHSLAAWFHLQNTAQASDELPDIIWLRHNVARRFARSRALGKPTSSPVCAAIGAGALGQAVEWLEAGRSLVWAQVLALRNPLDELEQLHSNLLRSESLEDVHAVLQSPVIISAHLNRPSSMKRHRISISCPYPEAELCCEQVIEYERIFTEVRRQPGFEDFMRPKRFSTPFRSSTSLDGYVVFLNAGRVRCDAVVLSRDREINVVALTDLSLNKAEKLRSHWQTCIQQQNARERGMAVSYQHSLNKPISLRVLSRIWKWIVYPVVRGLGLNNLQPQANLLPHITWCPTGPLTQLPLHAAGIYEEESGPRVYDYVVSSYTPSLFALTRSAEEMSKRRAHCSVLIVTQPDTPGLPMLPGAMLEGERLRHVFLESQLPVSTFSGKQATTSAIRNVLAQHSWLHLACHGSQDLADPTKSAFALNDGPLSLADLTATTADNAELAFLSACQTAVGDERMPEESMHLAAGMLVTGFKGVVATMWSIRDADAPQVVETYYKKLLELRASAAHKTNQTGAAYALHEATKRLREEIGETEVVRWAPFVHFGI